MDAMVDAYHFELAGNVRRTRELRQARGVVQVVIEIPQIDRASKSKGDPNDLPPCSASARRSPRGSTSRP